MTDSSQYRFISSVASKRKAELIVQSSNFSIDHILNKAGNTNAMVQQNNECNFEKLNNKNVNTMFVKSDTNFTPILNWLQYTRYHPPRLPRKYNLIIKCSMHVFTKLIHSFNNQMTLSIFRKVPWKLVQLKEHWDVCHEFRSHHTNWVNLRVRTVKPIIWVQKTQINWQ